MARQSRAAAELAMQLEALRADYEAKLAHARECYAALKKERDEWKVAYEGYRKHITIARMRERNVSSCDRAAA